MMLKRLIRNIQKLQRPLKIFSSTITNIGNLGASTKGEYEKQYKKQIKSTLRNKMHQN